MTARTAMLTRARGSAGIACVALATFGLHLTVALQAWARYTLGSYDLVIFDQAIRSYSRFGLPVAMVKSVHNGFPPDFSILGDHVSPILALLAPLYWGWDDPRMLLVAQAALFAGSVPVVHRAARRVLRPGPALALAAAYGIGWPLQSATIVGFHEVAFAVPITAVVVERALAERWRQAALVSLPLLLVKEDMGLVVAMLGVAAVLARDPRERAGRRRLGAALVVVGLLAVVLSIRVVIPAFGGRSDYYWEYDALGPDPVGLLAHVVRHPLDTLHLLVTPSAKAQTLLLLLVPVGFLALGSPLVLLAFPLLAERLLSDNENVWTIGQHYNAFLWPVMVLAAFAVVARLPTRWREMWAFSALGAAVVLSAWFPFGHLIQQRWWQTSDRDVAAADAVAAVPSGALVEADNHLGPHLTRDHRVLLLDQTPRDAPWVALDTRDLAFPFAIVEQQVQRRHDLQERGYRVVYDRQGWVVLTKTAPARTAL